MALIRKSLPHVAVCCGGVLLIAGVALVYVPAALILAGGGLVALGLFVLEVE